MASAAKHVVSFEIPMEMLLFLRNFLAVVILLPYVITRKSALSLGINNKRFFFIRCVVGIIGMLLMFYSIDNLSVTDFVALSFLIPIFASIGAVLFLSEHMGWHRWAAVIVGFAGAMVVVKPGFEEIGFGVYICLAFCACTAAVLVMTKKLSATEDSFSMMYYMHIWMMILSLPLLIFYWDVLPFPVMYWSALIALLSIFAHYALIKSYTYIDISLTAPFEFSRIIMAAVIAYIFLDEIPEPSAFIGAAIIVASVVYIVRREKLASQRGE